MGDSNTLIFNNDTIYDVETGLAFGLYFPNAAHEADNFPPHWTYVCEECSKKHKIPENRLYGMEGAAPPCGVEGCDARSSYFYDFFGTDSFLEAAVRRATRK